MTLPQSATPLSEMSGAELETFQTEARRHYDAFKQRGVKLNLTRGKPSARQLDLCNDLLALPGVTDYRSGAID